MSESEKSVVVKKRGQPYTAAEKRRIKELYIANLLKNGGLKTAARKAAGTVDFNTLENWKRHDPKFAEAEAEAVEQGCEALGDFIESKLMERVKNDDTTAIIFALKTKYKSRGYTERSEVAAEVSARGLEIVVQDSETAENLRRIKEGL